MPSAKTTERPLEERDGEAVRLRYPHDKLTRGRDDVRDKMPVDVTVHDPRASVIRLEPDGNVVGSGANANYIALNRVHVVVDIAAGASNDTEDVTVQVNGVLGSPGWSARRRH